MVSWTTCLPPVSPPRGPAKRLVTTAMGTSPRSFADLATPLATSTENYKRKSQQYGQPCPVLVSWTTEHFPLLISIKWGKYSVVQKTGQSWQSVWDFGAARSGCIKSLVPIDFWQMNRYFSVLTVCNVVILLFLFSTQYAWRHQVIVKNIPIGKISVLKLMLWHFLFLFVINFPADIGTEWKVCV